MKKVVFALLALALSAPFANAHLDFELLTPDEDLFPECRTEPESPDRYCPYRLQIEEWDVYLSPHILSDEWFTETSAGHSLGNGRSVSNFDAYGAYGGVQGYPSSLEGIIAGLENIAPQLRLMERDPFPKHFASMLREKGAYFFITPRVRKVGSPDWHRVDQDKPYSCETPCYGGGGQIHITTFNISLPQVIEVLVHEMAHAWHDLVVPDGSDNQCIKDAYRFSVERDQLYYDRPYTGLPHGVYRSGLTGPFRPVRSERLNSYASVNRQEYFAEIVRHYFLGRTFSADSQSNYPFNDRWGMYDVDRNGYFTVFALFDESGSAGVAYDCDEVHIEGFPDGWWPE